MGGSLGSMEMHGKSNLTIDIIELYIYNLNIYVHKCRYILYMSAKHNFSNNVRMVGYINAAIKNFLGFDFDNRRNK